MATTTDYDKIISGMLPSLRTQQKGMHDYLAQAGRRQGTAGAMGRAREAVSPYAEKVGEAIGRTAPQIAQLKEKERQFGVGQQNWEKLFEQHEREQSMADAMNKFKMFGTMTPEMLEQFGFGDATRGGQRGVQNQLDILGIGGETDVGGGINSGFNRPNPAIDRLFGRGGGGAAPRSRTISSPSDPFRRVTGPGQGPGLQTLRPT